MQKITGHIFAFTLVAEFFSRGALWARVLLLGLFVPVEDYAFILTLLGVEGLLAAVLAYPSIKDVLVRQELSWGVFRHFGLFLALLAAPVASVLWATANLSLSVLSAVLAAAALNALCQVGLHVLRVVETTSYNRVKVIWAGVTTVVFLVGLSAHWAMLPAIYLAGALTLAPAMCRALSSPRVAPAFTVGLLYHIRGWAIYGSQALLNSFPQYGTRLFVAATMSLVDVATFTQTYMVATALFFAFSAVMVVYEPALSRAGSANEIATRIPLAIGLSGFFAFLTIGYGALITIAVESAPLASLIAVAPYINSDILMPILLFIALNGVHTVANCLVLASSSRGASLAASIASAAVLILGLLLLLGEPTLIGIGFAIALSQGVGLGALMWFSRGQIASSRKTSQ